MIQLRFSAIAALIACAIVLTTLVRIYPQENVQAPRESAASGNAQGDSSLPAFRSGIDLVALNVTLTDGQDQFAGGLSQNDFAVFEDGVQQDVSFFAFGRVPLDLAILLDTSSSMLDSLETAQKAAIGFVETIREQDRVTTIQINDRAELLHPLTSDTDAAIAAIRRTTAHGATALYNALFVAMTEMARSRRSTTDVRRQAIALLSDGQDTASLVQFDEVMALAKESGIAVYTISLLSPLEVKRLAHAKNKYFVQSQFVMKSFADVTGGQSFIAKGAGELRDIYGTIASELANQYTLGYVSRNPRRDGAFRRVVVRVVDRPELKVRTRAGYQTARPPAVDAAVTGEPPR